MAFGTSVLVDFKYITHFERIKQMISHFSERIINSFSRFSERIIHGLPRFLNEKILPLPQNPHFSYAFLKNSLIFGRKTKRKAYGMTICKAH